MQDLCGWLQDSAGSMAVGRVLRHECLSSDFAALSVDLDIECTLPWRNASRPIDGRPGYRHRYDADARRLVEIRFSRTLARFGYDF